MACDRCTVCEDRARASTVLFPARSPPAPFRGAELGPSTSPLGPRVSTWRVSLGSAGWVRLNVVCGWAQRGKTGKGPTQGDLLGSSPWGPVPVTPVREQAALPSHQDPSSLPLSCCFWGSLCHCHWGTCLPGRSQIMQTKPLEVTKDAQGSPGPLRFLLEQLMTQSNCLVVTSDPPRGTLPPPHTLGRLRWTAHLCEGGHRS